VFCVEKSRSEEEEVDEQQVKTGEQGRGLLIFS
jgi:hypothetical protein